MAADCSSAVMRPRPELRLIFWLLPRDASMCQELPEVVTKFFKFRSEETSMRTELSAASACFRGICVPPFIGLSDRRSSV